MRAKHKPHEYHYLVDLIAKKKGLSVVDEWIEILNETEFSGGRLLRCKFKHSAGWYYYFIIAEYRTYNGSGYDKHTIILNHDSGIYNDQKLLVEEYDSLKKLLKSFPGHVLSSD